MFHIANVFDGNQSVIESTWKLKVGQSSSLLFSQQKLLGHKYEKDTSPVLDGDSSWKNTLE